MPFPQTLARDLEVLPGFCLPELPASTPASTQASTLPSLPSSSPAPPLPPRWDSELCLVLDQYPTRVQAERQAWFHLNPGGLCPNPASTRLPAEPGFVASPDPPCSWPQPGPMAASPVTAVAAQKGQRRCGCHAVPASLCVRPDLASHHLEPVTRPTSGSDAGTASKDLLSWVPACHPPAAPGALAPAHSWPVAPQGSGVFSQPCGRPVRSCRRAIFSLSFSELRVADGCLGGPSRVSVPTRSVPVCMCVYAHALVHALRCAHEHIYIVPGASSASYTGA